MPPPALLESLGLPLAGIEEAGTRMLSQAEADPALLVRTAIVLALLEEWFGDLREIWEPVVAKTVRWFSAELKRVQPAVHGQDLVDWARGYVLSLIRAV